MDDKNKDIIFDTKMENLILEQMPRIPTELDERVSKAISEATLSSKEASLKWMKYIAASLVGVFLLAFMSLNIEMIAETISAFPIFRSTMKEEKISPTGAQEDIGIHNAGYYGFRSMNPIVHTNGDINIEIDEIFVDETRISFDITYSGDLIDSSLTKYDRLTYYVSLGLNETFPWHNYRLESTDLASGNYERSRFQQPFEEGFLRNMIDEGERVLSVGIQIYGMTNNDNHVLFEGEVEIGIQEENIIWNRNLPIVDDPMIKSDSGIIKFTELILSPTSLEIVYDTEMNSDTDALVIWNPRLIDDVGNEYEEVYQNSSMEYGKLLFAPSFMFSTYPQKLTLEYDGFGYLDGSRYYTVEPGISNRIIELGKTSFKIDSVDYSNDELVINTITLGASPVRYTLFDNNNEIVLGSVTYFEQSMKSFEMDYSYRIERLDSYKIRIDRPYSNEYSPGKVDFILEGDNHE